MIPDHERDGGARIFQDRQMWEEDSNGSNGVTKDITATAEEPLTEPTPGSNSERFNIHQPDGQGQTVVTPEATAMATSNTILPTPSPTTQFNVGKVSFIEPQPTTTSAAVSTSNSSGGRDGLAPGPVAGIAIATAVIGAAIAFLIASFLFKKRNRNERTSPDQLAMGKYESAHSLSRAAPAPTTYEPIQAMYDARSQTSLMPTTIPASVPGASANDHLSAILPPPADRSTLQSKVSELFARIHRHVDTFYRDAHATITPSMETELAKFGTGDVSMVELLQSSNSPTLAIKHALVAYVLGITSPDGKKDETLFPTAILQLAGSNGQVVIENLEQNDITAAYILHKRLSVHLYASLAHATRFQSLQSTIREAAELFALTFFPWANPGYGDQEKDEDLAQIIGNALDMIVWLYGQPYMSTEFIWEVGVANRGTVTAPGLFVVSTPEGSRETLLEPIHGVA